MASTAYERNVRGTGGRSNALAAQTRSESVGKIPIDKSHLAFGVPDAEKEEARPRYSYSDGGGGSSPVYDSTHRKLKPRHIQLIGIGGTIGTALFVQIGQGLLNGGPGSLFLAFTIW